MKTNIEIREDFPIFKNREYAYLDSAATSQRPQCVLDAMANFDLNRNANPNRGAYELAIEATSDYNEAREVVAKFINAKLSEEVLFTKNASEALNLVAFSYGLDNVKAGEEIVISIMEHHSALVPWQRVAKTTGATLKYMYINNDYSLSKEEIDSKITDKTKIVAITGVSNVLGTVNDVKYIVNKAHSVGAKVVCDISQWIPHAKFDVQEYDVDFAAFSGHKMFGPLGIGVLYGKKELLDSMNPFLLGGDMIEYVFEQDTTFAPLPNKFEAGTQNVSGAVGLKKAIEYINEIGYDTLEKIEHELLVYLVGELRKRTFVKVFAPNDVSKMNPVVSFNIEGIHPHDVASMLDMFGVCVRSGNHCAQPLLRSMGIDSTCRASISAYNTKEDIDRLLKAIDYTYNKFSKFIKKD